jgi:hypothetical protein
MEDLFFRHDGKIHRIVCIQYCDGQPHGAITDSNSGHQYHWDFEKECKWEGNDFMYHNSGSGGLITEIDLGDAGPDYWLHSSAALKAPTQANRLDKPLLINGDANIFTGAREIYQTVYCRVCDKYYDEDWCPDHHREKKTGDIGYRKGFRKRDLRKNT